MDVRRIDDAIYADDFLVAILVQEGSPQTVIDAFAADFDNGLLFEGLSEETSTRIFEEAKKRARGGLLKISDLETILNEIL